MMIMSTSFCVITKKKEQITLCCFDVALAAITARERPEVGMAEACHGAFPVSSA
jgi:hypothetical protein